MRGRPGSGDDADDYAADVDDLRSFVEAGRVHRQLTEALLAEVRASRLRTVARLGHIGPAGTRVDRSVADLSSRLQITNDFVDSVEVALSGSSGLLGSLPGFGVATDLLGRAEREIRRAVDTMVDPIDDAVMDSIPYLAAIPEISGRAFLGPLYPIVAEYTNTTFTPAQVMALWRWLDPIIPDGPRTGDPGGTFTTRSTGSRLIGNDGPPRIAGRKAVVGALNDTADGELIHQDEFQLIRHDDHTYTVVLPGVVDLMSPSAGFDPRHSSSRDTDSVAARSAASASVDDNLYARLVAEALERAGVPPGSPLLIVGHSQGADTALDLAADPTFNGERYRITHVVAAAYNSEPQLAHVQPSTRVLVLQNNKDVPVLLENLGHLSTNPLEEFAAPPRNVILREFDGGWRGAGHHQANYTSYLEEIDDDRQLDLFFSSIATGGYGRQGQADAIDITNPSVGWSVVP